MKGCPTDTPSTSQKKDFRNVRLDSGCQRANHQDVIRMHQEHQDFKTLRTFFYEVSSSRLLSFIRRPCDHESDQPFGSRFATELNELLCCSSKRRGCRRGETRIHACMSRLDFPSAKPSSSVRLLFPTISRQLAVFLVLLVSVMEASGVSGIGCFVCSSFDGENKGCEDPFNSTMDLSSRDRDASAVANYNYPCWAYKKGRHGLFPADHCIKIVGYRADNESKTLVIRTCALDSGTLTADTEIVRISHCGSFKYEGHQYKGCVQSCDTDGCNSSSLNYFLLPLFFVLALSSYLL
ncbi:hypothetical protein L3Y34_009046 [Caenorhabditis briggsae]|uniref:Protein sleepless n=2 Tax=Caenorhabditis briggsae TaxID=6238 RepID=A0AAE9D123_CAEBR|nr:hypothetical protein L3Y34_009046 [Caenorhabditis briggsae]